MPTSKPATQQKVHYHQSLHQSLSPSQPVAVASVSEFVRIVARVWKDDPARLGRNKRVTRWFA